MGVLKKILLGLVVIVLVLLGIGFLLPREVHVERSATIDAPRATVYALVSGFRSFNKWSPWAALDPGAAYTYEGPDFGVGAKMSWRGDSKSIGTGSQEVVEAVSPESVTIALDFGAQGKATARFVLVPQGEATKVTWGFDTDFGNNPLARYMGLMFDRWIGPDYEKGLAGLEVLAESLPKTDFTGLEVETVDLAPITIAYVEASSTKDEQAIAAAIGGAYGLVGRFMSSRGLKQVGAPITINTEWQGDRYLLDAGIPIDRAPDGEVPADSPVKVKQTYSGKALKVVHKGAYREMATTYDKLEAYAAAHGYETASAPWDEYVSDPGRTHEAELITNIYWPVK